MTYPTGTGIPEVTSGTSWGSIYNASNLIPTNFLNLSTYTPTASLGTGAFANISLYPLTSTLGTGAYATIANYAPLVSPSFTTPALGTPASGVITNLTGTCTSCSVGGNAATATSATSATTAGNLSGTPALPNGTTATTQTTGDNTTKLATDAFVLANSGLGGVQIGGDIGGTNAAPVVTGIEGRAVAATAPANAQVLIWNTSLGQYVPGPVVAAPAVGVEFYPAAVSDGGTAFAAAWTRYDHNEPQTGSINPAASAQGYMAYQAAPVQPQYAELTVSEPGYWTGTGISLDFFSAATTGNVTWEVQAVCIAAGTALTSSYSPTFSTPVALTTAVSSTADGLVTTATASNLISPGTGSCPSSPTTPTKVTYRIYRAASDTAAGNANLLGATLLTGRSQ